MSLQERKPTAFVAENLPSQSLSRLAQHCDLITYDVRSFVASFDELIKDGRTIDAIVVQPFSGKVIDKQRLDVTAPHLKVVCTVSVGLDHIDVEECKKRGVKVGYTPNVLNNSTAELTVALTLLTARRLEEALQVARGGRWGIDWWKTYSDTARTIAGSVVGFVGLGRIGFATAKRFKSFEPSKIVYCGNSLNSYASEIDAEFVTFHDLLNVSDFVIVTCSLSSSTKHLMNAEAFTQMKSSAILVNIARGAIVDQDALYLALTTNQIAAAGLDVTTPEPLPADHKLFSLPNCVITPHIGVATIGTREAMCDLVVDNLLAGLNGQPLPYPAY